MSVILDQPENCLEAYKERAASRYDRAANKVYAAATQSFLTSAHINEIAEALVAFDMSRLMGRKENRRAFKTTLIQTVQKERITSVLRQLREVPLLRYDSGLEELVAEAYNGFLHVWKRGDKARPSHVGTTKLLHFLIPDLFLIIDSNVRTAFRHNYPQVGFRSGTQPGYSVERYQQCMAIARKEILTAGESNVARLAEHTPLPRIFDKVAFTRGVGWC